MTIGVYGAQEGGPECRHRPGMQEQFTDFNVRDGEGIQANRQAGRQAGRYGTGKRMARLGVFIMNGTKDNIQEPVKI